MGEQGSEQLGLPLVPASVHTLTRGASAPPTRRLNMFSGKFKIRHLIMYSVLVSVYFIAAMMILIILDTYYY
jgi:hypothetical protein